MQLQLEAARATPALSRFNYDAMKSLKSLNLSIAVLLRFYRAACNADAVL